MADYFTFCESEYGVPKPIAELIASALAPCHPEKPLWLVFETQRHPFWTDLGRAMESLGLPPVADAALMRQAGPLASWSIANELDRWYSTRNLPRILVDTQGHHRNSWRGVSEIHSYWRLASECLRTTAQLTLNHTPDPKSYLELQQLLRNASNPNRRTPLTVQQLPPALVQFIHWISGWNREVDPDYTLFQALSLLPSATASLYSRSEPSWDDWQPVRLMLKGMVKSWWQPVLRFFWLMAKEYDIGAEAWRQNLPSALFLKRTGVITHSNPNLHITELRNLGLVREHKFRRKKVFGTDTTKRYNITAAGWMLAELLWEPYFDPRKGFKAMETVLRFDPSDSVQEV
jgi:hypothetical protein